MSEDEEREEIIKWFENLTERAQEVQSETLREIIELNLGAEYLKKWIGASASVFDFDDSDVEACYSSCVPLATHADFEPYIKRISDGDASPILTHKPIPSLSLSSGTTEGRAKCLPFTCHSAQSSVQVFRVAAAYRSRVFPIRSGGKILEFIYGRKPTKTKGGLPVTTATTHYFTSKEFKEKQKTTKAFTCSPDEVINATDHKQATYCHLLFGLLYSNQVEFLSSTFSFALVQAFKAFEQSWQELCTDIRDGTLSPRITSPELRRAVVGSFTLDPELARSIEERCNGLDDWFGVIPKLWPNAKYVYSIMTGAMQPYVKKLRHYSGDLPLVSAEYGASECWIGVNIEPTEPPERVTFVVVPNLAYFEFIPLFRRTSFAVGVDDFDEGRPVGMGGVQVGGEYEVVVTTFTGLYRYRLGDVVQVVGFHNGSPKLSFVGRRKLILTLTIDKNTEKDLQLAVERGSRFLSRAELVDFTSHADLSASPGHYVVYWELCGHEEEEEEWLLKECCRVMDEAFADEGYKASRRDNGIGPLELCIVEEGTFRKILEHFISKGGAMSQFKMPRCTSDPVLLSILNGSTMRSFLSTAYR
ncbi:jasmonic acid-amido synthetase JAR1 isoform X2 [Amborella trichopoda]|uniref:jasmonic acid-amido synthetase JAR1 isoform X2 n=1 Tax=Amborella trichopoda TaxID=13333 RepID=UPI0005D39254|nr:jasmonic acid-amido synthetase JAR1 isoform X2 [Amborella trichopoda]|eukprot:XP_011622320.1 jasmonic acid-amido synthetase JAR1 isoform X2 [Amborella trichopoda]